MPRNRSKSEERERKRIYRQNRTPEKIATDKETDRKKKKEALSKKTEEAKKQENNARRERMARLRNDDKATPRIYIEKEENRKRIMKLRAQQTLEEKEIENEKAKERMISIRARKKVEEKEQEREEDKQRKRDITAERSTEECDYERIVQRQGKKKWRQGLSGKDHLVGNLIAKKGMQLLNVEGRLRRFAHREAGMKRTRKKDNLYEWKQYMQKSEKHKEILSRNQPDIVSRINKCIRQEQENERQKEEDRKKGYWDYNGESGEYYWTGDTEPEHDFFDSPDPPTKEEIEIGRQAQERELEELMKQRKHEIEEKRQKKNKERRAAMQQPVNPLPERKLCQYEIIREEIIREREELMAKFEFMENLKKTKEEIGLYKKADKEEDN